METMRCLLGHTGAAATINQSDKGGRTALFYACCQGRSEAVRILLQSGADPTVVSIEGDTAIAFAWTESTKAVCKRCR